MGRGAHLEKLIAESLDVRAQPVYILSVIAAEVALVRRDYLSPSCKLGGVFAQLRVYRVKIRYRIAPLGAGDVDKVYQQSAAVDMPQEIVPESRALGSALDDAGDVRHDKGAALVDIHHAEIGEKGGEVIVCDLRVSLAHDGKQCALAHVGETHEPYIGQKLQLKGDIVALAGQTGLGKARHLTGRCRKVLVAPAAPAAARDGIVFAVGHIVHDAAGLGIAYQCAAGHADIKAVPVPAGAALALTVGAVSGNVLALVPEVHQGGHIVVNDKNDVAALAAVASVGAAGRDVFLAVEGDCAVAAVAGSDAYSCFIHKRGCHSLVPPL